MKSCRFIVTLWMDGKFLTEYYENEPDAVNARIKKLKDGHRRPGHRYQVAVHKCVTEDVTREFVK